MKRILRVVMLLCLIAIPSLVRAAVSVSFSTTSNLTGCNSVFATFTPTTTGCTGTPAYTWYYINNPASTASDTIVSSSPNHSFSTVGNYNVVVKVVCGGETAYAVQNNIVHVTNQPTVSFAAGNIPSDTMLRCAGVVNFNNLSSGDTVCPGHTWRWIVNGPGSFTDQTTTNASFNFTNPGDYTVTLIYQSTCGCVGSTTRSSYIHISGVPTACITRTDTSHGCSAPVVASFSSACSSGGASYTWSFSDGGPQTTTATTISHQYNSPGTYNVSAVVTNSVGCTATSSVISVHVGNFTAVFAPIPDTVCENAFVTYRDNNTADIVLPVTYGFYFYPASGGSLIYNTPASTTSSATVQMGEANFSGHIGELLAVHDAPVNGNGCGGDAVRYIYIRPRPATTVASVSMPYRCSPSDTTVFHASPSVATNTYTWSTPGATVSSFSAAGTAGANPTFTYSALGTYTAQLAVSDVHGCTDTTIYPGIVQIAPPIINIASFVDSGCTPIQVCYRVSAVTPANVPFTIDGITFGDGSSIGAGSYTDTCHSFSTGGSFLTTVHWRLPASLGGCTGSDTVRVLIGANHPHLSLIPYPIDASGLHPVVGDSICPNTSVFFADTSTCAGCTLHWNIRVPPSGLVQTTTDTTSAFYSDPSGTGVGSTDYTAQLISCLNGCCDTLSHRIFVFPPPITTAALSASAFGHCNSQDSLDFTVTGATGSFSYHWDFGVPGINTDTAYTTLTTPGGATHAHFNYHNYLTGTPASGDFVVRVWAYAQGPGGYDHFCHNMDTLLVHIGPQDKNWSISDTIACVHDSIIVNGPRRSDGSAYARYVWSFGDGVTKTANFDSVSGHGYSTAGTYTVRVIFTNQNACPDTGVLKRVHVYGPSGGFTAPSPVCAGSPVTFTDHNTFVGTSIFKREVNFIAPSIPPYNLHAISTAGSTFTNTYPTEGSYLVILSDTESSPKHCASFDSLRIVVKDLHPYFTSPDTLGACKNLAISFHDTNTNCLFSWNFGDGPPTTPSAADSNITHTYTANGNYTVSVTITTIGTGGFPVGCAATYTRNNYIHLTNVSGITIANYGDTAVNCPPLQLAAGPTNTSTSYLYTYAWNLTNPNHNFPANTPFLFTSINSPGNHVLTMIATSPRGCVDSQSRNYLVGGPSGYVTATPTMGCGPLTVMLHFTDTGSIAAGSSYIWDACPFGSFTTSVPDTTLIYSVPDVYCPPSVVIQNGGCAVTIPGNDSIHVYASPTIAVTHAPRICYGASDTLRVTGANTYTWYPSSLCPSSCSFVVVSPLVNTTYTVVGTNLSGCTDTAFVTVVVDSPLVITVTGRDSVCIGQPDTLTAHSFPGAAFTWHWYPGPDSISGLSCSVCNPNIIRTTLTRTYWAKTTNAAGCSDSASFKVTINPLPILHVTPDPAYVCINSSTQLHATGAATYVWYPILGLNCDHCPNPVTSITSNIIYSLTGTTAFGCTDSITVPVEVYNRNVVGVKSDTIICAGDQAHLKTQGGISYIWRPGNTLNDSTIYNPTATPSVTTIYTVYIHENPCFDTILYEKVTVIPIPILKVPPTITIIAGNSVQLYADSLNHVVLTSYEWTPADSTLTCTDCAHPIATPVVTTTYSVSASTIEGCTGHASVTIKLLCENSQVFIPNTFTPNGDGNNDRFYVSGKGLGIIKRMAIYNRWGELMFEGNDIHPNDLAQGWDGTFRGEILAPDVYVYVLDITCSTGEPFSFKGDISLVR